MSDRPSRSRLELLSSLLCLLTVAACSSAPQTVQLGEEESFDGLRRVINSRISQAWVRPDLDLSGYTAILPVDAGTQFVPTRPASRVRGAGARPPFPISPENRERIEAIISDIFRAALQKSERFTIAPAPGPDVLTIEAALLDVVSYVPPEPVGRGEIYLSEVGAATLAIEIRDSESNAVLARFFDRRSAGSPVVVAPSSRTTNTAEVRRLLSYWAELLRKRLDEVPTLTEADD